MRCCAKCGRKKIDDFFAFKNKAKGTRQSYCKECMKGCRMESYRRNPQPYKDRAVARRRVELGKFLQWLSSKRCVDCGEDNPVLLDCDHVRGKKVSSVGALLRRTGSWRCVQRELAKCEVRCVACHRLKTAREQEWFRLLKKE